MHRSILAASFLVASVFPAGAAHGAGPAVHLNGVWVSVRQFSPAMHDSRVTLMRSGDAWIARIGDANVDGKLVGGDLAFAFQNGGELRVRSQSPAVGQWIQPASETRGRLVSPVSFAAASPTTWTGRIAPIDDVEHLYLAFQPAASGGLQAFIRNPESNAGAFVGMRTVHVDGTTIRLQRAGSPEIDARYDAKADTLSLTLPMVSGAWQFVRGSADNLDGFAPRRASDYTYRVPASGDDGWPTASLNDVGIDGAKVAAIVTPIVRQQTTSTKDPYIQSIAIARHGKLVLDEYFYGFDADRPHDIRSAGKSITTLLVGTAMTQAGYTPQTRIEPIFARYAPFAHDDARKQEITIGDLMTMRSGYACDDDDDASPGNEDTMQSQTAQSDWYKFTLDLPMASQPGTAAIYCSAGINLLGGVISSATNMWLPEYFYDRIAAPMQFGVYALQLTPPPLSTAYMAGGEYLRPRDFLKLGQLFLDGGRWDGRRIVDPAWLEAAATVRTTVKDELGNYGYGWHLYDLRAGGMTYRVIAAGGNGGQLLFAIPQLDMTIAVTAGNYGQYGVWRHEIENMLPAIVAAALPGNQNVSLVE